MELITDFEDVQNVFDNSIIEYKASAVNDLKISLGKYDDDTEVIYKTYKLESINGVCYINLKDDFLDLFLDNISVYNICEKLGISKNVTAYSLKEFHKQVDIVFSDSTKISKTLFFGTNKIEHFKKYSAYRETFNNFTDVAPLGNYPAPFYSLVNVEKRQWENYLPIPQIINHKGEFVQDENLYVETNDSQNVFKSKTLNLERTNARARGKDGSKSVKEYPNNGTESIPYYVEVSKDTGVYIKWKSLGGWYEWVFTRVRSTTTPTQIKGFEVEGNNPHTKYQYKENSYTYVINGVEVAKYLPLFENMALNFNAFMYVGRKDEGKYTFNDFKEVNLSVSVETTNKATFKYQIKIVT